MNKERYEKEVIPGVTPKIRRSQSFAPKSDEEFSKQIDAKISRQNRSKVVDNSSSNSRQVGKFVSKRTP